MPDVNPNMADIYNRLHGVSSTTPSTVNTFVDWSYQAGDVINVEMGGRTYTTPIYSASLNWKGMPINVLESTGNVERKPVARISQQKSGGGGGASNTAAALKEAYIDIDEMNGRIDIVATDIVHIKADVIDLEGEVTVSSIVAKLATAEYLTLNGTLYAYSGIDAFSQQIQGGTIIGNTLQTEGVTIGSLTINASGIIHTDSAITAGIYVSAPTVYVGDGTKNVATDLNYVTGFGSATSSGGSISIPFYMANSQTEAGTINFNIADTAYYKSKAYYSCGIGATGQATNRQGHYLAQSSVTISAVDQSVIETRSSDIDVTAVYNQAYSAGNSAGYISGYTAGYTSGETAGYTAGWNAAVAMCGISWSGSNTNVLTISMPSSTVDTAANNVIYSIGSYKASGDTLRNVAPKTYTYTGSVYTTVTPTNDPSHSGVWTASTVNISKTQVFN